MRALLLCLALVAAPAAFADAIPGPEELSAVQETMIGTWQQTEQAQMRDHGQQRTTFVFDNTRYVRVNLHIIGMAKSSDTYLESGTWTGRETGAGAYELTLAPDGGAPAVVTVRMTGAGTADIQLWPTSKDWTVPFARVFPAP